MKIKIGKQIVGDGKPCYIIAEAGVNHNGDINIAKKLVDAAKDAGSDAVKFQTFKAENIVTAHADMAPYQKNNTGKAESQYAMLKRLELKTEDFIELKKYCDIKGIVFMSTPHSGNEDVDVVAKLSPAIKIGSGDITNLPILEYIAQKNLPVILSTGMATMAEIEKAVRAIKKYNQQLIILHCTTNYPTSFEDVNMRAMLSLKEKFKTPAGYSDHTEGIIVPLVAVSLGACVIEKHFTLNKNMEGPDHKASLEPNELKEMVKEIKAVEKIIGSAEKKPTKSEIEIAKVVRKSIVTTANIEKGQTIRKKMLAIKRPGTGIAPELLQKIIGKLAKRDIKTNTLLSWNDIK